MTGKSAFLISATETRLSTSSKWPWAEPAIICVSLALMTLVVFAQTFTFEFLNFDDDLFVSANPRLASGLNGTGIAWAFSANLPYHDPNAEYWEPLTLPE